VIDDAIISQRMWEGPETCPTKLRIDDLDTSKSTQIQHKVVERFSRDSSRSARRTRQHRSHKLHLELPGPAYSRELCPKL
jgi:hypothetical protein